MSTINIGYLHLDSWSETYIGARSIVSKLPDNPDQTDVIHGPLSQMVLIASHQLVEIMLFSCIRNNLERSNKWNDVSEEFLRKLNFNEAFNRWPKRLTEKAFPKQKQPFSAARELASRRNATVHSESALTTLEMARSALHTAVSVSIAIQEHFEGQPFTYESVLKKYPIEEQVWFSSSMYPPS
ncbi:hypothetical protein [Amphritea pacifica]|uniref:hypothetical protein n=1 Tax=Amphritea pacifica TaxID=2811233 RepID=UPI001963F3AA|nr:hypothetical protein [Amphritea pacifica]MBN1007793.1 hypothetical protein [Amphritea pacifica]